MNGWQKTIQLIRDLGFPIFVATYLLLQLTPAIDRLTAAVLRMEVQLQTNHQLVEQQRDILLELRDQRR